MNKALTLEKQKAWDEALASYEEAILRREACVSAGMGHLLDELIRVIRFRLMTLLDLSRWTEAAADVVRFLEHAKHTLESGSVPPRVTDELGQMITVLEELSDDAWQQVAAGLGTWAEWVERRRDGHSLINQSPSRGGEPGCLEGTYASSYNYRERAGGSLMTLHVDDAEFDEKVLKVPGRCSWISGPNGAAHAVRSRRCSMKSQTRNPAS